MEKLKLSPAVFGGEVTIPPSKSFAHRALICAALSGGNSNIYNISLSRDIIATVDFLSILGMKLVPEGQANAKVCGQMKLPKGEVFLNCIESGSTLRFLIPVMAALGISCTFSGSGLLPQRPVGVYRELLPAHGVSFEGEGLPCRIKGKLTGGDFCLPGNISSQFISGLMFALPLLEEDSKIILTTKAESKSYIDITVSVLKDFGILIEKTDYGWFVKGGQKYKATDYTVEGDWSQAVFFMNLGAFSKDKIRIRGLNPDSLQGDRKCLEIYRKMGVKAVFEGDVLVVNNPTADEDHCGLKALEISAADITDMIPALSVVLAVAEGESLIRDAGRLRIKESDRLSAISNAINAMGGKATELAEGLVIEGCKVFAGGEVNGCNDHRIVMAAATAAARVMGDIVVTDPYSINKSYPNFYKDYNNLGGKANVINLG